MDSTKKGRLHFVLALFFIYCCQQKSRLTNKCHKLFQISKTTFQSSLNCIVSWDTFYYLIFNCGFSFQQSFYVFLQSWNIFEQQLFLVRKKLIHDKKASQCRRYVSLLLKICKFKIDEYLIIKILKGAVSVISIEPPSKVGNCRFTPVPLKP